MLATWTDQINPRLSRVDERYIAHVQELGMRSLVWTVDRRTGMRRGIGVGADGIITNRPARLTQLLGGSAVAVTTDHAAADA